MLKIFQIVCVLFEHRLSENLLCFVAGLLVPSLESEDCQMLFHTQRKSNSLFCGISVLLNTFKVSLRFCKQL